MVHEVSKICLKFDQDFYGLFHSNQAKLYILKFWSIESKWEKNAAGTIMGSLKTFLDIANSIKHI